MHPSSLDVNVADDFDRRYTCYSTVLGTLDHDCVDLLQVG